MIIAGCGIHRDIRNDFSVDLYIDLINAVTQILIMVRRDTIVFQQTFLKLRFLRLIIAGFSSAGASPSFDGSTCVPAETDDALLSGVGNFPQAERESTITAASNRIKDLYFIFILV